MEDQQSKARIRFCPSCGQSIPTELNTSDSITIGNIEHSSGIAIGRNASVSAGYGISEIKTLSVLLKPIYEEIDARPDEKHIDKAELRWLVENIQKELGKQDLADQSRLKRWLKTLCELAPEISSAIIQVASTNAPGIAAFLTSLLGG